MTLKTVGVGRTEMRRLFLYHADISTAQNLIFQNLASEPRRLLSYTLYRSKSQSILSDRICIMYHVSCTIYNVVTSLKHPCLIQQYRRPCNQAPENFRLRWSNILGKKICCWRRSGLWLVFDFVSLSKVSRSAYRGRLFICSCAQMLVVVPSLFCCWVILLHGLRKWQCRTG